MSATYKGPDFDNKIIHMGLTEEILQMRAISYFDQIKLLDSFINYSSIESRQVLNFFNLALAKSDDAYWRLSLFDGTDGLRLD